MEFVMSTKNIYIILTDTGTLLSRMIKLYTKDELNHVSISFDDQLSEVYSNALVREQRLLENDQLVNEF